ncbi:MAG: hypothetical protein QOD64_1636 [Verrucomicrobiota bacterium]
MLVLRLVIVIEINAWKIEHEHESVEGAESDVIPRLAERAEGPPTR